MDAKYTKGIPTDGGKLHNTLMGQLRDHGQTLLRQVLMIVDRLKLPGYAHERATT